MLILIYYYVISSYFDLFFGIARIIMIDRSDKGGHEYLHEPRKSEDGVGLCGENSLLGQVGSTEYKDPMPTLLRIFLPFLCL